MPKIVDINGSAPAETNAPATVAAGGKETQTKKVIRDGKQYTLTVEKLSSGTGEDVVNAIKSTKTKSAKNFADMSQDAQAGVNNSQYSIDDNVAGIVNSDDPEAAAYGILADHDVYNWTLTPDTTEDSQKSADSAANSPQQQDDLRVQPFGTLPTEPAKLTLTTNDGAGTKTIIESSEFLLTGFNFVDKERAQIIQCFDSVHVQAFGRSPMVLDVAGVLIRAQGTDWYATFMDYYERYFRVSKSIEQNAIVVLNVDNTIYEGHVLSINIGRSSTSPIGISMQFPMIVYKKTHLGKISSTVDYTPPNKSTNELQAGQTSPANPSFIGPQIPANSPLNPNFVGPVQPQTGPGSPGFIGPTKPADVALEKIISSGTLAGAGVSTVKRTAKYKGGGGTAGGGGSTGSW